MENKYQKAYDIISDYVGCQYVDIDNAMMTLQEALNELEVYKKALDNACDSLYLYDRFDNGWSSEQWKEWALDNEN